MDASPYLPPLAPLLPVAERNPMFYVVARRKFWILTVATLGAYSVYWFYRQWATYKAHRRGDQWPVMRALFSIFFTHDLFRSMAWEWKRKGLPASAALDGWATLYVIAAIVSNALSRINGHATLDLLSLLMVGMIGWPLARAQRVANTLCEDPEGRVNHELTWANWLWILLGALVWFGMLLTLWEGFGGPIPQFLMED